MPTILIVTKSLVGLVILLHLYFLYLEMFVWTSQGPKVFKKFPKESFETTKVMAGNQGLYNGFLALGLIWSLLIQDINWANKVGIFFLICVLAAGIYGAVTVSVKIFFIQALPALAALVL